MHASEVNLCKEDRLQTIANVSDLSSDKTRIMYLGSRSKAWSHLGDLLNDRMLIIEFGQKPEIPPTAVGGSFRFFLSNLPAETDQSHQLPLVGFPTA
jgi:hypothetical protein